MDFVPGALYHIFKQREQDLYMTLLNRTIPIVNQIVDQAYNDGKSVVGKEGKITGSDYFN